MLQSTSFNRSMQKSVSIDNSKILFCDLALFIYFCGLLKSILLFCLKLKLPV